MDQANIKEVDVYVYNELRDTSFILTPLIFMILLVKIYVEKHTFEMIKSVFVFFCRLCKFNIC